MTTRTSDMDFTWGFARDPFAPSTWEFFNTQTELDDYLRTYGSTYVAHRSQDLHSCGSSSGAGSSAPCFSNPETCLTGRSHGKRPRDDDNDPTACGPGTFERTTTETLIGNPSVATVPTGYKTPKRPRLEVSSPTMPHPKRTALGSQAGSPVTAMEQSCNPAMPSGSNRSGHISAPVTRDSEKRWLVPIPFRLVECPLCTGAFVAFRSFARHCASNHSVTAYAQCGECGFSTPNLRSAACHVPKCPVSRGVSVPIATGNEECPHCEFRCSTSRGLSTHLRHRHPIECNATRIARLTTRRQRDTDGRKVIWSERELAQLATLEVACAGNRYINTEIAKHLGSKTRAQIASKRRTLAAKRAVVEAASKAAPPLEVDSLPQPDPSTLDGTSEPTAEMWEAQRQDILDHLQQVLPMDHPLRVVTDLLRDPDNFSAAKASVEQETASLVSSFQAKFNSLDTSVRPRRSRVVEGRAFCRDRGSYARCQWLFKKNCQRLADELLIGGHTNLPQISKREITEYFMSSIGSPNSKVDLLGFCRPSMPSDSLLLLAPIKESEVKEAVKRGNKDSAAGPDGVLPSQLLAACNESSIQTIAALFSLWLFMGQVPISMKACRTVLIPKTDKPSSLSDFRPISISSCLARLFSRIIVNRLSSVIHLHPRQKGFVPGEPGCVENAFIISALLQRARTGNGDVAMAFLDVHKAFDTVGHSLLVESLRHHHAAEWIIDLVSDLYTDATTVVEFGKHSTAPIPIRRGVKQGDPLSPFLFNVVLDTLIQHLETRGCGLSVLGHEVSVLAYADDLVLVSRTPEGLSCLLNEAHRFLSANDLRLSVHKCRALFIKGRSKSFTLNQTEQFRVGGDVIPWINAGDEMRYLGVKIDPWRGKDGIPDISTFLAKGLRKLHRAPLKPFQRLKLLRVYLVPRLFYPLRVGSTSMRLLDQLDRAIRRQVKAWLKLPACTSDGFMYSSIRDSGLGLPCLRKQIPLTKIRDNLRCLSSRDKLVSDLAENLDLVGQNRTLAGKAGLPEPEHLSPRHFHPDWRAQSRATWYSQPVFGQGAKVFQNSRVSNFFLREPGCLRPAEWISAIQLRANVYPTRESVTRGRPDLDRRCRGCDAQIESLSHLSGACAALKSARIQRHNGVCKVLARAASRLGWKVLEEARISSTSGRVKQPDLIIYRDSTAYLIDVTVRYESSVEALEKAYNDKVQYYMDCLPHVRKVTLCPHASTHGLVLGARGGWTLLNNETLKPLGLNNAYFKQQLIIEALRGTLRMLRISNGDNFSPR